MAFKSAALCSRIPKRRVFAFTQFLRALGNLLLEIVFGLAQFLFQRFLRRQVSDDDADRVCLRLELGKRHQHGNLAVVAGSKRIFAPDALLVRLLQVFKKLFAQLRHDEVAERNATGVWLRANRGCWQSCDCCRGCMNQERR